MDELFWIVVAVLLIGSILIAPIATWIICAGLRRRQTELSEDIKSLRKEILLQPKPLQTVSAPAEVLSGIIPVAPRTVPEPTTPPRPPSPLYTRDIPLPEPKATPDLGAFPTPNPNPVLPSAFEVAARKILSRIWNWIIVGEEFRKPGTSVEYALATNWLVRVGVLVVVVGVGFFLDYSSTRGWLGPMGKVSFSLLAGSAMLAGGIRLLGKKYHLIAQGLLGAGLATGYASIFAACNRYDLIGAGTAFALMAGVTAGAGFMSVRFNSMLVAILGILGGYGTPIMLSTGSTNFIGLYSYMLLLGVGVLGIAHRRNWRLLNALAFVATYGLVAASLDRGFSPDRFWEVMPFLSAFFILFSTVIFIYQIVNAEKATLLELMMLLLNAGIFFGFAYPLIQKTYSTAWCAAVALGLAAFYTGHIYLFLKQNGRDRGLALGFISLAAFFLIVTVPLLLSDQWLTLCWSVQALILLWLSAKLESRFLQYVAYGLYLMVFARFFCLDLYGAFGTSVSPDTTLSAYLSMLTERLVTFGVPVASVALAMRLLQKPALPAETLSLDPANDVKAIIKIHWALAAVGGFVFAMLFVYLHLELNRTLMFIWNPLRLPLLSGLWILACMVLLSLYVLLSHTALLGLLALFIAGTLIKLIVIDLGVWHTSFEHYRYMASAGYSFLDAGMRLIDYGVILAFFGYAFRLLTKCRAPKWARYFFGYGGVLLLLSYTTLEINSFFACFVPGLRAGGISVYWGVFALALVTGGLLQRIRPLRFAGLSLFLLVALKVFVSDLAQLDPLYKIVAFTLLGAALLAGAFVYLRFQDRFDAPDGINEKDISNDK